MLWTGCKPRLLGRARLLGCFLFFQANLAAVAAVTTNSLLDMTDGDGDDDCSD